MNYVTYKWNCVKNLKSDIFNFAAVTNLIVQSDFLLA